MASVQRGHTTNFCEGSRDTVRLKRVGVKSTWRRQPGFCGRSKDGVSSAASHDQRRERTRGLYSSPRFRTGGLDARFAANVTVSPLEGHRILKPARLRDVRLGGIRDESSRRRGQFKLELRGRFSNISMWSPRIGPRESRPPLLKACRGGCSNGGTTAPPELIASGNDLNSNLLDGVDMLDVEYRKHGLKLNAEWFCETPRRF